MHTHRGRRLSNGILREQKGGAVLPSIKSKLLSGTMKSVKPILTGIDVAGQRKGLELMRYIHPKAKGAQLQPAEDCPLPGTWAVPTDHPLEGKVMLYTHGGAYVSGSPSTHEPLICRLAEQCRLPVLAYEYRLAPESPYPAALQDAAAAFDYLLSKGYRPEDIALCGDSAGGGLSLALALYLRDQGRELPAALVLLSPWTDLTESLDSHYQNTSIDPLISSEELREMALLYAAGQDLHTPYISPLFGCFEGLPPTLIHVGSHEVLLDDARELALRMEEAGVAVDIDIYEGMWHVFHMFDVEEARDAIRKIRFFLHTQWELDGLRRRTVRPGQVYRHFKGQRYRVLAVARHSETLEELVVYQQLYGSGGVWVRPLAMFLEPVERDGKTFYRFEEEETADTPADPAAD